MAKIIINELRTILTQDKDFLKPLLTNMVQEILEAEMDETFGANSYELVLPEQVIVLDNLDFSPYEWKI